MDGKTARFTQKVRRQRAENHLKNGLIAKNYSIFGPPNGFFNDKIARSEHRHGFSSLCCAKTN
jgi:hypothetical protein